MSLLILGLVLFLGVHTTSIVSRAWRDGMVERLGEGPWKGAYSLVSLVGFGLIETSPKNDIIPVVVGLVLYAVFVVWAHQFLFGVGIVAMG